MAPPPIGSSSPKSSRIGSGLALTERRLSKKLKQSKEEVVDYAGQLGGSPEKPKQISSHKVVDSLI